MTAGDGLTTTPNVFQRLMLQWETLAPYNAAQLMTIDASAPIIDPARAWRRTVLRLGLQQLGQHPDAPLAAADSLEGHVNAEMNRPFAPGHSPLRPFVVLEGARLHLGVVYRHVVADSASIRVVMRDWFARLFGVALPDRFVTLDREPGFAVVDRARRWSAPRELLAELTRLSRLKRVRRLDTVDATLPVAWRRTTMPAGTIDRLIAYARREGVRVHDVFLAAAALAGAAHVPMESNPVRRDIGVGTIVDTRAGIDATSHFGLRLGFLQTFIDDRHTRDGWATTLRAAATSMRVARDRDLAAASVLRLFFALRYGRGMSPSKLADFYRKRCPLVGGISNVNLNRDWPARVSPSPLLGYARVSPTGPMLPLVFTPTTLGDALDVGFTYRTGDVSEPVATAVFDAFVTRLTSIE